MTKTKTTKRALFASILSLLLCVSMLIGSTFAWFTDSASTGVNTIKSGTLDVGLEMLVDGEWVDAEGQTLGFVDEDGNILENILWEPGCSYLLQPFKIVNNGDLALKFDIIVSGFTGDAKLAEAIEYGLMLGDVNNLSYVKVGELNNFDSLFDGIKDSVLKPGESSDTSEDGVTLHMKETAGNEYQNLTLSGMSITIIATQATVEKDSYTDQYDKDAEYPVVSPEALDEALADTTKNNIVVGGGKYTSTVKVPSGKNLTTDAGTFDTRDNMNYEVPVDLSAGSALTINDGTFMGSRYIMQIISVNNGTLEVNEGTFTGGALAWVNADSDIVINGGTFNVTGLFVCDDAKGMKPVEINGGEFTLGRQGFNYGNPSIAIVINGGTFNVNPAAYVGEGHSVVDNGDGTWTVQ